MPMIDVYATAGTFQDKHSLARDLAEIAAAAAGDPALVPERALNPA
jgi:phenylpyruvate tautomerase PptA (4-oxalocrotonate tautomerase family)